MKSRRKRYIIDRKLQLRLFVYNGIYFFIVAIAVWAVLVLPLASDLSNPHLSVSQHGEVAGRLLYLHSRLGPVLLIIFLVLGIHSVLVSHKIAGPLYRFKATFSRVAQGDLSGVGALRRGDLLHNEQKKIDEMIRALSSRLRNMIKEHAAMEQALQSIIKSRGTVSDNLLEKAMADLESCHLRLKKS